MLLGGHMVIIGFLKLEKKKRFIFQFSRFTTPVCYLQELVDSVVNGNVDPTVKRQRVDGTPSWLTHLSGSTDPVTVKLLCGADLLESFARPGLWKEEDVSIFYDNRIMFYKNRL